MQINDHQELKPLYCQGSVTFSENCCVKQTGEETDKLLHILLVEKIQNQVCCMLCTYIHMFPQLSQYSKFIDIVYKTLGSTNKYFLGKCWLEFHLKLNVIPQEGISVWKYKGCKKNKYEQVWFQFTVRLLYITPAVCKSFSAHMFYPKYSSTLNENILHCSINEIWTLYFIH